MNEFVSWCRHLLVSFLFHALTSLHPRSFYRNDFSTCKTMVCEPHWQDVIIVILVAGIALLAKKEFEA